MRLTLLASIVWWMAASQAVAQRFHRQDFEGKETLLRLLLSEANAQSKIETHELTTVEPHAGKQAERMVVRNIGGETCLVGYPIPSTLIAEELSLSVWVKANRPGVKIAARVVLPNDKDPKTGGATVLLLEGESGTLAKRWDSISVPRVRQLLERQQGYLQGIRKANVDIRNAYVDMLVLNIHTGPGLSDITVDDLEVGPLVPLPRDGDRMQPSPVPANLADRDVVEPDIQNRTDRLQVQVKQGRIIMGERGMFIRGIRRSSGATAAPFARLSEAQFNTVFLPWPIDRREAEEAERLGMRIVPMLELVEGGLRGGAKSSAADLDVRDRERWLAWHIGHNLDAASAPIVRDVVSELRSRDVERGRPIIGHVVEGFRPVSRELDINLVQRYPLMSTLSLQAYGEWLAQRHRFSSGLPVMINAIQVHPPMSVAQLAYGHGPEKDFQFPIGPQPIQLELLVCHTLAAHYRGLVFSTDWALSSLAAGFDRMVQSAIVNEKLTLFETFFAEGSQPEPCKTNNKNIKAVVFPHERGLLVMAYWNGPNSQYCVGQATIRDVQIIVPGVPDGAQAHVVGPARMENVNRQNGLGGTEIQLREIDGTAFVLLTTETSLLADFQERLPVVNRRVAPLYLELAKSTYTKAMETVARLQGLWKSNRELYIARQHLQKASQHIENSKTALAAGNRELAISESCFALRIVRYVEEMFWSKAASTLPSPTIDPFAVSFYTLPEHLKLQEELKKAKFGSNILETGNFEREGNLDEVGWQYIPFTTNGLEANAVLIGEAKEGARALELSATPSKDPKNGPPPKVVEHTRVSMISPPVPVRQGQVARITGYVRLPQGVFGSVDGAMVYDSVGGETLALRFDRAVQWTPFVMYRPIRADGKLRVHLVMTGMGAVQFDDLRVDLTEINAPIAGKLDAKETEIR